jgi:hypothetical protein
VQQFEHDSKENESQGVHDLQMVVPIHDVPSVGDGGKKPIPKDGFDEKHDDVFHKCAGLNVF